MGQKKSAPEATTSADRRGLLESAVAGIPGVPRGGPCEALPLPGSPFCWRRNLVCLWLAQVLSIMGFAFAMSFAAYYIQQLGVTDPGRIMLWNGVYQAAGPLTFAIMSPIWGALGDRYGRRLMLLRASFMAAIVVFAMGYVRSVEQLIVLRLFQGIFTGTVSASLTLVASTTPQARHGLALGSLQSSLVIGWMSGSALGGILADTLGYAPTIRLGAVLLLLSGIIVLVFVREDFVRPPTQPAAERSSHLEGALPVIALFMVVALARRFDATVLPIFIQALNQGVLAGSATMMGQLTAVCCVAAALSSVLFGWLVDRWRPGTVASICALLGGALAASQFFVVGFGALTGVRTAMALAMGGLEPAFQVWLTRTTSVRNRGRLLGYSVSAKNIGWVIASLSSASLANLFGIRTIFAIEGALLIAVIPFIAWAIRRGPTTEAGDSS